MRIARTWVFPILRILIFVVIAAALVKLAFFAAPASGDDGAAVPTGEIVEPQVPVATATVTNDVVVDATVEADAPSTAPATLGGTVTDVLVTKGQVVAAGDRLAVLRSETPQDPLVAADGTVTERKPLVKTAAVTAPVAGTVVDLSVIKDQLTSVGDPVAKVAPPTFHVTAPLAADDLYRLVSRPVEGTVAITGRPGALRVHGSRRRWRDVGDLRRHGLRGGRVALRHRLVVGAERDVCRSRRGHGLLGPGGEADDPGRRGDRVLTVPLTAVEGAAGKGVVTVVADDGTQEKRDITLGINDGTDGPGRRRVSPRATWCSSSCREPPPRRPTAARRPDGAVYC